jgi:hypothetical protein
MVLNKNSRLVRWTYLVIGDHVPVRTSLCMFFWRAFLITPIIVILVGVLFILASPGLVIAWCFERFFKRSSSKVINRIKNSVFVQGAATIKGKVCPIITFE